MHRRKLIWVLVPTVCVAIALAAWMGRHPASRVKKPLLAVSFLGYSNSANGQAYAVVGMTNLDSCDLILWGPYLTEFSDKPGASEETTWCSLPNSALRPGSSFRGVAQVPAHQEKWRVRWMVQRWRLRDRAASVLGNWTPWDTTSDMDGVVTDWIPR